MCVLPVVELGAYLSVITDPFLKVWLKSVMRQWRQFALLGSDAEDELSESLLLLPHVCTFSVPLVETQTAISGIPRVKNSSTFK